MIKERESSIDLLKIIAMFMVIGVHLFGYGGLVSAARHSGIVVQGVVEVFNIFFRSAVNIFIIITGFFTVNHKFDLKKSYKKVLKTYLIILFYSMVLSVVTLISGESFWCVGNTQFDAKYIIIRAFLPLTSQYWYFLTDYVLLLLVCPFINIVLQTLDKKQYQVLLLVLGFVMSIWLSFSKMFLYVSDYGYEGILAGKNLFSFVYLYIFGGYIALYTKKFKTPKFVYLLLATFSVLLNFLLNETLGDLINYKSIVYQYANPFVILCAVFMFMFFKDIHFKSKIITLFASTTIGVYAISEFKFIREWLWNVFSFDKISGITILKVIIVILIVFVSCSIIELLRQQLFKCFKSKTE